MSYGAKEHGLTTAQLFQWRKARLEGSLVAVGANETVVPAPELQKAMRRIKQLEGAMDHKILENVILKETVAFAKTTKWIARGRAVRAVCQAIALSRSNLMAKKNRTPNWTDGRKSPPFADDDTIKQAIAGMVQDRATYGHRRAWARLRIDGHRVNHKRG